MAMIVVGTVLQAPTRRTVVAIPAAVIVADDGTIDAVLDRSQPGDQAAFRDLVAQGADVVELPDTTYLLPGLIDLHVHAPQWPQLGTGLDLPLERWLFEYTFPLEARFDDPAFAAVVWADLVGTLLAHGTTTAVYYGPRFVETTTSLAATCVELGQRAFVGRVAMDHPEGTPEWYRDANASSAIADSHESIVAIEALASPLVAPIITPRFAPACTDAVLAGLGELAEATGVLVQTHCSESDWEHGAAFDRFGCSDAEALDGFGLLRPNTVLAHADHMSDADARRAAASMAGVAHCPLSNAYFANAVFPARRFLDLGLRVGLGTDIAGGPRPGVLSQVADAVTMSRLLEDGTDAARSAVERGRPDSRITTIDAFWMATVGGAEVLGLSIGQIEAGRRFDAIAVDVAVSAGSKRGALRVWDDLDDPARTLEKIVNLATPNDITHVWVDGRRVDSAGDPLS